MKGTHLLLCVLVVFGSLPCQAHGATTTFDDKAVFLAATGATSATGPLPNLGLIPGGTAASQTLGTLTFSITPPSSQLFVGSAGLSFPDWYPPLVGNDMAISDIENLNVDSAGRISSFGFDIVEPDSTMPPFSPSNFPTTDATFTITLKNGGTVVDTLIYSPPNDVVAFWGLWADVSFDRVEIHETMGGIDDEYFGQFYTGPTVIPAPSALLLVGYGLLVMIGFRGKKLVEGSTNG
jgi:hypothetical protein